MSIKASIYNILKTRWFYAAIAIIISLGYIFWAPSKGSKFSVKFEEAERAIDQMKEWCTWIVGLQTAAIGAIGFLLKETKIKTKTSHDNIQKTFGFFALFFFGFSIALASTILGALSSLALRLNFEAPSVDNDIYFLRLYGYLPVQVGPVDGMLHLHFVLGIIFFSLFIYRMFWTAPRT